MSNAITNADWQNVLKLLMLTMLSDGRAYERQADTFVNTSLDLRTKLGVKGIHTRQMTMDWYIRNRTELVDIRTGETFENDLLALIDSLDTLPNKKPLLKALKNLTKLDETRSKKKITIAEASRERWAV